MAPLLPTPSVTRHSAGLGPSLSSCQQALSVAKRHGRVRLQLQIDLQYEIDAYGADFVFNIHAAQTPAQAVRAERLVINQAVEHCVHKDPVTGNRYLRLHGNAGLLEVSYSATVDIHHYRADPCELAEVPVRQLPQESSVTSTRAAIANPTDCCGWR